MSKLVLIRALDSRYEDTRLFCNNGQHTQILKGPFIRFRDLSRYIVKNLDCEIEIKDDIGLFLMTDYSEEELEKIKKEWESIDIINEKARLLKMFINSLNGEIE